jgi:hypothetical protein
LNKVTYVIASTTAEDAYAAQKSPGLLYANYQPNEHSSLVSCLLDHRPTREGPRVASSDQYPWRLTWFHSITPRHGKVDSISEIIEIINGLLDGKERERLGREVVVWIGIAKETVFDKDGCTILLLSDETIDGFIGSVGLVT